MAVAAPDVAAMVFRPGTASLLEWRAGPNGVLMTDVRDLQLIVGAQARFVDEFRYWVLRRQYGRGSLLAEVEGGVRECLHDAIAAAERAALRLIP